jgi:hypothetical protein
VLFVEDVILLLSGAVDGQAFVVGLETGDSFGQVFGEEKLAGMGNVATGVFLRGGTSDVGFHVDVDGAAGVPAGVDRFEFSAAAVVCELDATEETGGIDLA